MWEAKRLRVTHIPAYPRVLQLAKERQDAILLDVGCCCMCLCLCPVGCVFEQNPLVGNDLRKVVVDGWHAKNVIGFELRKGVT